jgi:molybdate transport system regulatory protein
VDCGLGIEELGNLRIADCRLQIVDWVLRIRRSIDRSLTDWALPENSLIPEFLNPLIQNLECPMDLKVKWWLEKDGGLVVGKGRCMLLEAIDRLGSLREAARVCDISYRAAWGKLRASEQRLGEALVETRPGKRGMTLTPRARELLQIFHSIDQRLEEATSAIVKKGLTD